MYKEVVSTVRKIFRKNQKGDGLLALWWFVGGLFVGANIGFMALAMMFIASKGDDDE